MFLLRLSIVLQTTWHFFFEWFLLLLLFFFLFFLSHFISLYFYIKHRCTEHCSAKLWSVLKTNDDLEIKKKCKNERGRLIVHRRALSIRRSLYFRINRSLGFVHLLSKRNFRIALISPSSIHNIVKACFDWIQKKKKIKNYKQKLAQFKTMRKKGRKRKSWDYLR